mmetsp:Transcript_40712/g.93608  ORF Transcript_40712/g.93608 Transcript_40712/m.93608 type:complete len:203 (-) Transcript_40712:96-704(-)
MACATRALALLAACAVSVGAISIQNTSSRSLRGEAGELKESKGIEATHAVAMPVLVNGASNMTVFAKFQHEVEHELHVEPLQEKSKTILMLMVFFCFPSMLGCDRCYLAGCGNPLLLGLGVAKGLTAGGLGIWWLIDATIVLVNCLAKWESMNALGMQAAFDESELEVAFWLAVVYLVLYFCGVGPGAVAHQARPEIAVSKG